MMATVSSLLRARLRRTSASRLTLAVAVVVVVAGMAARVQAQSSGGWFEGAPTFGGLWVWSDLVIYDDWRIQKNSSNGNCRLLDPRERRYEYGDFETCLRRLDAIKAEKQLPPLAKDVVIVVHGLGGNRAVMAGLCDYLHEKGGLTVINFGYPSTILDIGTYAQSLDSVIRHLQGVETISFVAHSMGNIVVRKYLKDVETLGPEFRPNVTLTRMVMISPPNHGAELADTLSSGEVTRELSDYFAGESAKQLAPKRGWPELEPQLATPAFEFGIIAGGKGDDEGRLRAIPGDDDGMLSVDTMRLAGASDFMMVDALHQLMPQKEAVRAATLSYLKNGWFVTADARRPIGGERR